MEKKNKYKRVRVKGCVGVDGNKQVLKHRHIMEKHIGRKLKHGEVVHHIDGNVENNNLENLLLLSNSEHTKLHWKTDSPFMCGKRLPRYSVEKYNGKDIENLSVEEWFEYSQQDIIKT